MSESEHRESSENRWTAEEPLDWNRLMARNVEAWQRLAEIQLKSIQANTDIARITAKHMSEAKEDLEESQNLEDGNPRETYRKIAQHYSEMIKEILGTPSVMELFASNMDAFLDWKNDIEDVQEQYLKSMNIVSRGEMSAVYKNMHELKRKVEEMSRSKGEPSHGRKRR
jgi:hypothetical protein